MLQPRRWLARCVGKDFKVMIPTIILQMWALGLLALGVIGAAAYLGHEWQQRSWAWDPTLQRSVFAPDFGANAETAMLAGAVALLLLALIGRGLVKAMLRMKRGITTPEDVDPRQGPKPRAEKRLTRTDGSELQV